MPFFRRFCGLHLNFCVLYLLSVAPKLPSRGGVTFSVPSGTGAAIIGATLPNWLTDEGLVDALAAWNPDFVGQSDTLSSVSSLE